MIILGIVSAWKSSILSDDQPLYCIFLSHDEWVVFFLSWEFFFYCESFSFCCEASSVPVRLFFFAVKLFNLSIPWGYSISMSLFLFALSLLLLLWGYFFFSWQLWATVMKRFSRGNGNGWVTNCKTQHLALTEKSVLLNSRIHRIMTRETGQGPCDKRMLQRIWRQSGIPGCSWGG